jgi:hypothetical protein
MIVFFVISALLLRKKLVQSFTKESGSKSREIEMANDTSIYEVGSKHRPREIGSSDLATRQEME